VKALLAAVAATMALLATGASAANSSFLEVAPRRVEAGTAVTVHDVVRNGCPPGSSV